MSSWEPGPWESSRYRGEQCTSCSHTWSWSPPHCPASSSAPTAYDLFHWPGHLAASSEHWCRLQRRDRGFWGMWLLSAAGGASIWYPGPYSAAQGTAPTLEREPANWWGLRLRQEGEPRAVSALSVQGNQVGKEPSMQGHHVSTLRAPFTGVHIAASLPSLCQWRAPWTVQKGAHSTELLTGATKE